MILPRIAAVILLLFGILTGFVLIDDHHIGYGIMAICGSFLLGWLTDTIITIQKMLEEIREKI